MDVDPDCDYDLYDCWLPVNYGWISEPTKSVEDGGLTVSDNRVKISLTQI